jgi:hypothetical protein
VPPPSSSNNRHTNKEDFAMRTMQQERNSSVDLKVGVTSFSSSIRQRALHALATGFLIAVGLWGNQTSSESAAAAEPQLVQQADLLGDIIDIIDDIIDDCDDEDGGKAGPGSGTGGNP